MGKQTARHEWRRVNQPLAHSTWCTKAQEHGTFAWTAPAMPSLKLTWFLLHRKTRSRVREWKAKECWRESVSSVPAGRPAKAGCVVEDLVAPAPVHFFVLGRVDVAVAVGAGARILHVQAVAVACRRRGCDGGGCANMRSGSGSARCSGLLGCRRSPRRRRGICRGWGTPPPTSAANPTRAHALRAP